VQAEDRGYRPSKAKYSLVTLIAHKYREGIVQSTPLGERKERETACREVGFRSRSVGRVFLEPGGGAGCGLGRGSPLSRLRLGSEPGGGGFCWSALGELLSPPGSGSLCAMFAPTWPGPRQGGVGGWRRGTGPGSVPSLSRAPAEAALVFPVPCGLDSGVVEAGCAEGGGVWAAGKNWAPPGEAIWGLIPS
jgi:hypothetical protein